MTKRDNIYKKQHNSVAFFEFNQEVVEVFDDMIERSVPGYRSLLHQIGLLANQFAQPNNHIYDLGCSTGNTLAYLLPALSDIHSHIFAIDSSIDMINQCKQRFDPSNNAINTLNFLHQTIEETPIEQATVVILNFTLQFIPPPQRTHVLSQIYQGLQPGGILVVSEKICFDHPQIQEHMTKLHHRFKSQQGYSKLEISQKRAALENVLIPETQDQLQKRLSEAGFTNIAQHFQQINFVSWVAFK